jgi:hypothetical protein
MAKSILSASLTLVAILFATLILPACGKVDTNSVNSSPETSTPQSSPAPAKTGFEADLDYVRKGQYTYIWVFSRKDGKPLDKNDAASLRTNAPQVVDWVTTEQGKKVIAGTNFNLEQGNLNLLKKRFVVEDYTSK